MEIILTQIGRVGNELLREESFDVTKVQALLVDDFFIISETVTHLLGIYERPNGERKLLNVDIR